MLHRSAWPSSLRLTCHAPVVALTRSRRAQLATSSNSRHERVWVHCRSNGVIPLDIHSSPVPTPRIVIWLPSGLPQLLNEGNDPTTRKSFSPIALSLLGPATVIQINYRLSRQACFPTPIHDILAGYDWVVKHVVPKHTYFSISKYGRRVINNADLHVCGELIGGSLASMLALTECRLGSTGINAAFVNNPIVDWVGMHEPYPRSDNADKSIENDPNLSSDGRLARRRKKEPQASSLAQFASNSFLPTSSLLSARSSLFKNPSSYFDPFASPSLFFRTPGIVPPLSHDSDKPSSPLTPDDDENKTKAVPRKAYLKYPPSSTALRLPPFRIEIGAQCPLRDQIEEFVALLLRSHRTEKAGGEKIPQLEELRGVDGNNDDLNMLTKTDQGRRTGGLQAPLIARGLELAGKVQFRVKDGVGIWDGCTEEQQMETVATLSQWLKGAMPSVQ